MVENSRLLIGEGRNGRRRGGMSRQQWAAVIGGSALAVFGIVRRSPLGYALAAGGGTLAVLGGTRKPQPSEASTWTSILINCSPEEAYRFWRDVENLPRFMNRIENVSVLEDGRTRWVALGPMGGQIQWDSEITEDRENESIAWRSLPGSGLQVSGEVEFRKAPADRGTLVSARIRYSPAPGGNNMFSKFLSKGANFAIRQDLRRLEALMETGEIPTTEGQSHGPRDVVTGVMRVADPTRPLRPGSSLREAFSARRSIA